MSHNMRFPTMWYVRQAACAYAQSDQSLCYSLEYSMDGKLLNEQHLVSILKRRVHRLICAYSCQNATLLEINLFIFIYLYNI